MRRFTVQLIARRELRDLVRDRRTLFIVLILPAILYPVFGLVGFLFALTSLKQEVVVGVIGAEFLPSRASYVPPEPAIEAAAGAGLTAIRIGQRLDEPPLIDDGRFANDFATLLDLEGMRVVAIDPAERDPLGSRQADVLLVIPSDFRETFGAGGRPVVKILGREGDELSKLAVRRVGGIIGRWQQRLKETRFARQGLPADFDQPLEIIDPQERRPIIEKSADEIRDMMVKFFPFLLVMWTMAGALHPAIDLTAGEKERGTMETLLISPAERGEIVAGKFLAVWVFSYVSALSNLFWMGGAAFALGAFLGAPVISIGGLVWAALFAMPLAALFSSIAIGLGVFARSSKEGQYYLMPLFVVVMPLCLWSMSPGLKPTLPIALAPITGLTLLLQRLMSVSSEPVGAIYTIGVAASLVASMVLSLWWAASQFRRESVLFREAERLSLRGWLRSIFQRPC
jgi:sodium transport system permease protein